MKYYAVANIDFTDVDWVDEYLKKVTPMVESVGGKYLARTPHVEVIEGECAAPQTMLIVEFPSKESATAFYNSEDYLPYKEARQKGSSGEFFLVAGEDIGA